MYSQTFIHITQSFSLQDKFSGASAESKKVRDVSNGGGGSRRTSIWRSSWTKSVCDASLALNCMPEMCLSIFFCVTFVCLVVTCLTLTTFRPFVASRYCSISFRMSRNRNIFRGTNTFKHTEFKSEKFPQRRPAVFARTAILSSQILWQIFHCSTTRMNEDTRLCYSKGPISINQSSF